jgi:soluble lytic murein transglycosylase-like protein
MKIPIHQNLLASSMYPRDVQSEAAAANQGAEETLAFTAFLDLSLKNNLAQRPDQPPLAQMRLQSLIELVELQMQKALLSAFNQTEQDTLFSPISAMPLQQTVEVTTTQDASKIEHHAPQSDNKASSSDYQQIIAQASRTYGVDATLITSVIRAESDFDPQATSSKGAMGLMQLMPDTARDLGVRSAYDPEENIMAGTRYLKSLLDRYDGDIPQALAAYNWGMGNVERNPGNLPRETRDYIARITRYMNQA